MQHSLSHGFFPIDVPGDKTEYNAARTRLTTLPHIASLGLPTGPTSAVNPQAVHEGILCDACDRTVVGTRFKCLDCPDFDICQSCALLLLLSYAFFPIFSSSQYERIALTRFTKAFIFVAVAHCLVQIALQSVAFSFNRSAGKTVAGIIQASQMPRQYAFVSNERLFVCSGAPQDGDMFDAACWPFAGPGVAIENTTQTRDEVESRSSDNGRTPRSVEGALTPRIGSRDISAVPTFDDGAVIGVNVTGLGNGRETTQLSTRCIQALNWPSIVYVPLSALLSIRSSTKLTTLHDSKASMTRRGKISASYVTRSGFWEFPL